MRNNINNKNNFQENIFYKISNINIKDYIPNNIKQNNIREEKPLKFPEVSDRKYPYELFPNSLFEKWPSDAEIISFDFNINSNIAFNDVNNYLLVLPYSLRKEAFNSIIWMRPNEYIKQNKLIKEIKETFPNKNFNFIKNKLSVAYNNILNFKIHKKLSNNSINIYDEYNNKKNENNIKEIINEEEYKNDNKKSLNSIDNFKLEIKKRNSIDMSDVQGEVYDYCNDFMNGKLSNKERNILEENERKQNYKFFIVNSEIKEYNEEIINDNRKTIKKKISKKEIEIKNNKKIKLLPNNLNLNIYLCDYCRWVSSIFQVIIDNNICTEDYSNHFLRRIYPQDENGIPIYNPSGRYWIKLYHMGEERKIEIDDKFPVNKFTYEPLFPQCESPYELWPLLLTKAIIKLYSYKYRSEYYEYNEVGDNSILYSLTKYIGIQLNKDKFYSFLKQIQISDDIKKNNDINLNEENKNKELTLLKNNNNNFNYDLLIGYYKSKDLNIGTNKKIKILINSSSQQMFSLPIIKKASDFLKYNEKFNNLKKRNSIIRNSIILKDNILNIMPNNHALSPSRVTDFSYKFNKYNRFKNGEGSNLFRNSQKYSILNENKILNNGIICDIGYSILELFLSHHFNMNRTRPIPFDDLKSWRYEGEILQLQQGRDPGDPCQR